MNELKEFYTRNDVARRLSVSLATVAKLLSSGALKYHKIGRAVRISAQDLTAFVESSRQS